MEMRMVLSITTVFTLELNILPSVSKEATRLICLGFINKEATQNTDEKRQE